MTLLNVLMLAIDDLRMVGRAFGDPECHMPNLDRLSLESNASIFQQAYVQASTCGVSRTSLLTSRRPDTTEVLGNEGCPFTNNPSHANWRSLPQYFREVGNYKTFGMGKIFHPDVCEGAAVGESSAAWSEPYFHAPCISLGSVYDGMCYEKDPVSQIPVNPDGKVTSVFANGTVGSEDAMPDAMIAAHAVAALDKLGADAASSEESSSPFFMAHIAPKEYFDLYPLENISLPANPFPPSDTDNGLTWGSSSEFFGYNDTATYKDEFGFDRTHPLGDNETRIQRRAYYAAASFADAQLGKVLDALKRNRLVESTVIALFGDHGWSLGENNEWAKHTTFTTANRAPLLFKVPNGRARNVSDFVEFVDIFPTLVELAGLDHVPGRCDTPLMSQSDANCTEGVSLAGTVLFGSGSGSGSGSDDDNRGNETDGKPAAFGQWPKNGKMGYSVYTRLNDTFATQVRYTEWVDYNSTAHEPVWDVCAATELYNITGDPGENINQANNADFAPHVAELRTLLHNGWRSL